MLSIYLYGLLLNVFFLYHLNISRKLSHIGLMGFLIALMEVTGLRLRFDDALPNSVMMVYAVYLFKDTLKERRGSDILILISVIIRMFFYVFEDLNIVIIYILRLSEMEIAQVNEFNFSHDRSSSPFNFGRIFNSLCFFEYPSNCS